MVLGICHHLSKAQPANVFIFLKKVNFFKGIFYSLELTFVSLLCCMHAHMHVRTCVRVCERFPGMIWDNSTPDAKQCFYGRLHADEKCGLVLRKRVSLQKRFWQRCYLAGDFSPPKPSWVIKSHGGGELMIRHGARFYLLISRRAHVYLLAYFTVILRPCSRSSIIFGGETITY